MHETIKNLKEKEVEIISVLYILKDIMSFLNDLNLDWEDIFLYEKTSCFFLLYTRNKKWCRALSRYT